MTPSRTRIEEPTNPKSLKPQSCSTTNKNQAPILLPDLSQAQGNQSSSSSSSISNQSSTAYNLKNFLTQTWKIPDRPKPGRKPKEPKAKKVTSASPPKESGKAAVRTDSEKPPKKSSRATTSTSKASAANPSTEKRNLSATVNDDRTTEIGGESLQQSYINSLEEKIEILQKHQTEQTTYYKSLASQSNSRLKTLENEKLILKSQVDILRAEVIRLRKKLKNLTNSDSNPIVIEDDNNGSNNDPSTSKAKISSSSSTTTTTAGATGTAKVRRKSDQAEPHVNREGAEEEPSSSKRIRNDSNKFSNPGPSTQRESISVPQNPSEFSTVSTLVQSNDQFGVEALDQSGFQGRVNNNQINDNHSRKIPDFTSNDIDCGLCTSELDCVCRQVGLKPPIQKIQISESELLSNCLSVPIRSRPMPSRPPNLNIWTVTPIDHLEESSINFNNKSNNDQIFEGSSKKSLGCSGDPKDCPACRDDDFGRAFCTALRNSASSTTETKEETSLRRSKKKVNEEDEYQRPMRKKPRSDSIVDAYTSIPCCGDPGLCGSLNCFDQPKPNEREDDVDYNYDYEQEEEEEEGEERIEGSSKISCSDAWRKLKAHPNIGLANLQLLADVVSRKTFGSSSSLYSSSSSSSTTLNNDPNNRNHRESYSQQQQKQLQGSSSTSKSTSIDCFEGPSSSNKRRSTLLSSEDHGDCRGSSRSKEVFNHEISNNEWIDKAHKTLFTVFENKEINETDYNDDDDDDDRRRMRIRSYDKDKEIGKSSINEDNDDDESRRRRRRSCFKSAAAEEEKEKGRGVERKRRTIIKFVEKESLEEALVMLDRAG